MGFFDDIGLSGRLPNVDISGAVSNSWIYVLIISVIGFILIISVIFILYYRTYNKRIEFYENISGQGYQKIAVRRARVIKVGASGGELLKPFMSNSFFSASSRKMGRNTYWFAKGQDGYWYNILLGDLDSKKAMLDIEPIDRDVRMFHLALDRLANQTYGKQSFMEKYAVHMMLFVFLIVFILGMWFIVGKIGDATEPLAQSTENAVKIQEANDKTLDKLDAIIRSMGYIPQQVNEEPNTGIVPAS